MVSCADWDYESTIRSKDKPRRVLVGSSEYIVVEIDSCEYVVFNGGYGGGMTHKGNCKNPEHGTR